MNDLSRGPAAFQGAGKRPPYFEGWYYKLLTREGRSLVFIPGISLDSEYPHSFIQVIDSAGGGSRCIEYPLEAFDFSPRKLDISIGLSRFTKSGLTPDMHRGPDIVGSVTFRDAVEFPRSKWMPGIMGPFAYLPMRECRHDVIIVRCGLEGTLMIDGEAICFDGGSGYVEKDWGSSFPTGYLWMQGCGFHSGASFMLAVARVPIAGVCFTGVIGFLYDGRRIYRLATYTGARVASFTHSGDTTRIVVRAPGLCLEARASAQDARALKAPHQGAMSRSIRECVSSRMEIELKSGGGHTLFTGCDSTAGVEICGDFIK
ncbi:MAG: tocopherol cyclase family protein [Clostridia bacterium]|nr:tocopherol cyclase family protein [Clostridia bacterium]